MNQIIVSIPDRYAKNDGWEDDDDDLLGVSIPDRYAKNLFIQLLMYQRSGVSIPDRYAKNAQYPEIAALVRYMFQFLIGTLKTFGYSAYTYRSYRVSIPDRYAKNPRLLPHGLPPTHVSIPDRYAKNKSALVRLFTVMSMFQFLIGTLKTPICRVKPNFRNRFQFLIGTLKTN